MTTSSAASTRSAASSNTFSIRNKLRERDYSATDLYRKYLDGTSWKCEKSPTGAHQYLLDENGKGNCRHCKFEHKMVARDPIRDALDEADELLRFNNPYTDMKLEDFRRGVLV